MEMDILMHSLKNFNLKDMSNTQQSDATRTISKCNKFFDTKMQPNRMTIMNVDEIGILGKLFPFLFT